MGAGEGPWEFAALDKFILSIPAFGYTLGISGVMPPVHVINEILSRGEDDAGMSGGAKWKPFTIEQDEYTELVENLITNPKYEIVEDQELWVKQNYKKWSGALLSKYAKQIRNKS
jgi:hypothetical protein